MFNIKPVLALIAGIYFLIACNNSANNSSGKVKNDTTVKIIHLKNDSMVKKMDSAQMNITNSSMNEMMNKMTSMKMTGDFDLDFARMMIDHHQGAVDMSKTEIAKGADEKIKAIARNIMLSQSAEISKFQKIIKSYKLSKNDTGKHDELKNDMDDMKDEMNAIPMTGNTDKDFVIMMIAHHENAVKMFNDELVHGTNPPLKKIAQSGIADQTKEIDAFKTWLSAKK
ncbi:MAG: DUF305 domain-containing protein [Chitinophagaceae bacterium]|nr:DUF305 domain-containing protein [Chitinophagaceae bacterium]